MVPAEHVEDVSSDLKLDGRNFDGLAGVLSQCRDEYVIDLLFALAPAEN